MTEKELTLPVAAFTLGVSYEVARRQLFCGELEGRQDRNGRWLVRASSVERAKKARDARNAAPLTAA